MNAEFVKSHEKKEITSELEEQFGITKLPYLLIKTGGDKVRGFSGSMSKDEIKLLNKLVPIEIVGLYLLRKERDWRIGLDGVQALKEQITKNTLEISAEELKLWMRGRDIPTSEPAGTYVIKHQGDFIGCGRSNGKILFNYMPKERRIRN